MKITAAEREEVAYEMYLETGGREAAQEKNKHLALVATQDLIEAGWDILTENMKHFGFETCEHALLELVIRKGQEVRIIRWQPYNNGWFTADGKHGNGIFKV